MIHEFDDDTRIQGVAPSFTTTVTDRWSIAGVPNGGYVLAPLLRSAAASVSHPDPLAVSAHYLSPASPGPAHIDVDVVKEGRTLSTVVARLRQQDRIRVSAIASFCDLDTFDGPTELTTEPPALEADLARDRFDPDFSISARFDVEVTPPPTGRATASFDGRIRFRDGRPPDLISVPLLADSFTPAVFRLGHVGWSPTIELTVHLRNRPAPGWLTASVRTTMLERGIFEEDVELWDSTGTLVAHSRQLQLTTR